MRKLKAADLFEVSGSMLIVAGFAAWSTSAALIAAGAGCIYAAWRRS